MTTDSPFLPLSIPHLSGNEWKYIKDCLDTGWVSSVGPYVTRFEDDLRHYLRSPSAVATVNGTAALHIALLLCGVGAKDEVLVPTITFIAPINALRYVGAEPVFMDCDSYLNIDPLKIAQFCEEECIFDGRVLINKTSQAIVKAILPVHIFGHPTHLDPIMKLAARYHLKVIEDATESLGSFYQSSDGIPRQTGTIGDIGCFSFNGNKIITTGGGGMLVAQSEELADRARYLSTQAKDDPERFVHHEIGYNYRLTNLQAAMGCAQLELLPSFLKAKRANFEAYQRRLKGIPGLRLIEEPPGTSSNYWFYTLIVDERDYGISSESLRHFLHDHQIQTRPLWELNHRQRPYQDCQSYKIEKATSYHLNCLSLPCSVSLKETDIDRVAELIRKVRP